MFYEKIKGLKNQLTFKLTFLYALVFILSSLLTLSIFYLRVSTITMNSIDQVLIEESLELTAFADAAKMIAEIHEEREIEEDKDFIFRIYSPDGQVLQSWNAEVLDPSAIDSLLPDILRQGKPVLATDKSLVDRNRYRTVYKTAPQDTILQIGRSLEENEAYLETFQHLIALLVLPICLCAAFFGWIVSRKAMQGVAEVTQTALDISQGAFDRRVKVENRSAEIDRLARVFNIMVDRLQGLLQSTREMNDNIAHDLRSPLTRIRGEAEMMLRGKASAEKNENAAVSIIEECDNLIHIINTMLDITETEGGIDEVKKQPVDLCQLAIEAKDFYQHIAEGKGVTIITRLKGPCLFLGDKSKLQRMTTNLLENAIKYNRSDGRVTICVFPDMDHVKMVFEDNGIGISKEDQTKIFRRFYRCDRSRSTQGIGLGLSLSQAIAQASGGNIVVESELNQGSRFVVSLPRTNKTDTASLGPRQHPRSP